MNVGESWIANPMFPWLVVILALWVIISTISQARNWFRIRKLEESIKIAISESLTSKEKRSEELPSGKFRVRSEEQSAAAIEETIENGDDESFAGSQNSTGTESGSNETNQLASAEN